mgnify:CR=1 FL=1
MSEGQENKNVQQEQPVATDDASVDYKALYLDEVQNAKKLRKRAQESEATIQEFTKAQEAQKVDQLKEQEKFQELSESLQKQLDEVSPYKEKWESYEASERESLLSKLPEEDREGLKDESLKTLKYIAAKIESQKPTNPQPNPGLSRNIDVLPDNPFKKMDKEERFSKWDDIVAQYRDKHNKNLK